MSRSPNKKTIEGFMEHVEKTNSCWLWTGYIYPPTGYGEWSINNKKHSTHRIAYELFIGEIPNGLLVCHICDVRNCVNPDHLFLGTYLDNMQDMINKGRQNPATGEDHGKAKLTKKEVMEIRRLYEEKDWSQYKLAGKFNVSQKNISNIVLRKIWKHI